MKSLFILCSHFRTPHTVNQFGANYKNKKIKITVFNILPLLNPKVFKSFYNKENDISVNNKNFINIKSYFELFKILYKSNNTSYFYNAAKLSWVSVLVELFLINFKKFKKIEIIGEMSPKPKNEFLKEVLYFYKKDKVYLIMKILLFIFNKFFTAILDIISFNKSSHIFIDNKKYYEIFKKKNHFNIHKYDNENYSKYLKSLKKRKRKKYIVFLDQDLDHNFEYSLRRIRISKFNSKIYWKKMNFFFSELEKYFKYKYKIVIASHHRRPKGDYPIKRKFIHNNTGNLVKDSILVLAHHSLSINYAIFYNKPILLLSTNIFNLHTFTRKNFINLLRKKLGLEVLNIDNKIIFNKNLLEKILMTDRKKHIEYFNKYLGFSFNKTKGEKWGVISKILTKN
jgi:hypothetical protein